MILVFQNWRIRSYSPNGYVIEQKMTRAGWRTRAYHKTLAQAVQDLFEGQINVETNNCTISAEDLASARACTVKIIDKLDAIAAEFRKVLENGS